MNKTSTSSAGPSPGKFAGGANLRATFRNVKRKTKGLPCRKSGICVENQESKKIPLKFRPSLPCEQSPLVFLLGTARRSERDSAELVYILCGADNPKTWIIMRNFRFDTGFITGFDLNRKLPIQSSSGK
jgi:hypothetical protein